MPMHPALRRALRQTAHFARLTGRNIAGDGTYGTPLAVDVRYEKISREILSFDGKERQTTHRLIVSDEYEAMITDRIWLPGDDQTRVDLARAPVEVHREVDWNGILHHFEIEVGAVFQGRSR